VARRGGRKSVRGDDDGLDVILGELEDGFERRVEMKRETLGGNAI
jgi:hypothetical protein